MLRPKIETIVVRDNFPKLQKGVQAVIAVDVLVGVPAEKAPREEDARGTPINNAALAYIHDNGCPAVNIPARPFMRPGIENARHDIESGFAKAASAALEGRTDDMMLQLNAVGIKAATAIRMKINTGPFLPIGAATIAARRRRGRISTKPLIDTGQMRNSITYVIRKRAR